MTITIALLQGVNVGKFKRIAMADLRQIICDLGGEHPTTLVNSGNVVFRHADDMDTEDLRLQIERAVSDHVGKPVPVVTRTVEEMDRIIAGNPYPHVTDPKCLHVEFLNEVVPDLLADLDFGADHLTQVGREVYMHLPNKMSGVTFDGKTLERRLTTTHTSRNWNTVTRLAQIAQELP